MTETVGCAKLRSHHAHRPNRSVPMLPQHLAHVFSRHHRHQPCGASHDRRVRRRRIGGGVRHAAVRPGRGNLALQVPAVRGRIRITLPQRAGRVRFPRPTSTQRWRASSPRRAWAWTWYRVASWPWPWPVTCRSTRCTSMATTRRRPSWRRRWRQASAASLWTASTSWTCWKRICGRRGQIPGYSRARITRH